MEDIKFSIVVPAFNEGEVIESFVESLHRELADAEGDYEIIIVDDGSTDSTFSIVHSIPGVKVIKHPYNKGNGAAVKRGIQEAAGTKVVIIDGDGQHDPKHIKEMIGLLDEYDLVVGARESFGVGRRGLGNVLVSKMASYLSGIPIPDLTSGYRAFDRDKMYEFMDLLPNRFSLPSTSTLAFATKGYDVTFISIGALARQSGKSSIHVLKDGIKFLVLIVRMVSLFKPLKIFVPVSIFLFLTSFLWSLRTIALTGGLSPTVTMLFLSGIFTLLIGLLVDQLAEARLSIGRINRLLLKSDRIKKG